MVDIKILGENIRLYRKALNLTQTDLADRLHVSFQAVSNWERGAAPPDLDNIVSLAELFSISVDTLLKDNPPYEPIFLGIDGGATKTEFVLFTVSGKILKQFTLTGSNPSDIGMEGCIAILTQGINTCLSEHPDISGVFAGLSGVSAGANDNQVIDLLKLHFKHLKVTVDNDAINVLSSGDNSVELAMICGTGSVVYARKRNQTIRYGGWGYLFDFAGSGYDIGRDAVTACFAYEDGLGEYTAIHPLMMKKLGTKVWDACGLLYDKGKPFIASMTPLVFEAYNQNDKIATEIVNKTAHRLAQLITKGAEGKKTSVVACGGVISHYSDILIPKILSECAEDTNIIIPKLPPVYGACRECLKRFKIDEPSTFYDTFLNEYQMIV